MNKNLNMRMDDETLKILEKLKIELGINKSNIVRMAVLNLYKQVKNMNK